MSGGRQWSEDPWEWAGYKFIGLVGPLIKKWLVGTLFGLTANAGILGGALAAYTLILITGWLFGWSDLEQTELLKDSAWVWVPAGWYVAGRELSADKSNGLLAMLFPKAAVKAGK